MTTFNQHKCGPEGVGETLATTDSALIQILTQAGTEWGLDGVWLTLTKMLFQKELGGATVVYEAGRIQGRLQRNTEILREAKHIHLPCSLMHPAQDVHHHSGHTVAELLNPRV